MCARCAPSIPHDAPAAGANRHLDLSDQALLLAHARSTATARSLRLKAVGACRLSNGPPWATQLRAYLWDGQSWGSSNRSAGARVASLVLMCPSFAMWCVRQGSAAVSGRAAQGLSQTVGSTAMIDHDESCGTVTAAETLVFCGPLGPCQKPSG